MAGSGAGRRRGAAARPSSPQPYALLGQIHVARNDFPKAQEMFAKALEVAPQFSQMHMALGQVYNLEGKPDAALREYEAVLLANPKHPGALLRKVARSSGTGSRTRRSPISSK